MRALFFLFHIGIALSVNFFLMPERLVPTSISATPSEAAKWTNLELAIDQQNSTFSEFCIMPFEEPIILPTITVNFQLPANPRIAIVSGVQITFVSTVASSSNPSIIWNTTFAIKDTIASQQTPIKYLYSPDVQIFGSCTEMWGAPSITTDDLNSFQLSFTSILSPPITAPITIHLHEVYIQIFSTLKVDVDSISPFPGHNFITLFTTGDPLSVFLWVDCKFENRRTSGYVSGANMINCETDLSLVIGKKFPPRVEVSFDRGDTWTNNKITFPREKPLKEEEDNGPWFKEGDPDNWRKMWQLAAGGGGVALLLGIVVGFIFVPR